MPVELTVDGNPIVVEDDRLDLMTVLREQCGITSVKDGCAPQGQCGCCTVIIDGQARVSCVTPIRRIAGRSVVTLDGLDDAERLRWAEAFAASGASQCGFCTPGIICRFSALLDTPGVAEDRGRLDNALAAHLCRCTGWQTIREAWYSVAAPEKPVSLRQTASIEASEARARLEGRVAQRCGPDVALGRGGFSADTAVAGELVAVPDADGGWVVAPTLREARGSSGKIQGRRTTAAAEPPLAIPDGEWDLTLRTSWVEPAALETETVRCEPGGEPSSALANGGAFGAKVDLQAELGETARALADEHGRPVRVVLSREDSVRMGPKRPPIAAGIRRDGTGEILVVRTPGIVERIGHVAPGLAVTEVDVPGPRTSSALRGAGWVEAAVLHAAVTGQATITSPDGATAGADVVDGRVTITVAAGEVLDPVVLRSYCIGAAHMGWSWVVSESLAVSDGEIGDLTIRSFGILRAADTPEIDVVIEEGDGEPVNGSDAVFAAVALAAWRHHQFPPVWPVSD